MSSTVEVARDDGSSSYVATVSGALAGRLVYENRGELVALTHTVVDPAHRGQGIASVLARAALDDLRATGRRAIVICPFVRAFIDKHPDYADVEAG